LFSFKKLVRERDAAKERERELSQNPKQVKKEKVEKKNKEREDVEKVDQSTLF